MVILITDYYFFVKNSYDLNHSNLHILDSLLYVKLFITGTHTV